MKIRELSKEDLKELIDRLRNKPTHVTALEKSALANYLEETIKEKKDALQSEDQSENLG